MQSRKWVKTQSFWMSRNAGLFLTPKRETVALPSTRETGTEAFA